jgi:hypothetical protein
MYDAGKIRVLTGLLLKQETRGKDGSRKKLFLLFFSYIIPGIFIPLLLYKQNSDPTGFEYSFLTFIFYSLIIAFSIITEFDNLIISKTEIDLFTSLPVDDELIVHAKLNVILRYVFILSLPLLIPGSIYYFMLLGSIQRSLLYFISGYMLFFFMINLLLFLYSIILKKFSTKRLSTYILIFQILLLFLLIIGYQFVSYAFTGENRSGISAYFNTVFEKRYTQFFPQSWFGYIPAKQSTPVNYTVLLRIVLPVLICYTSYLSLKYYLMENYGSIRERFFHTRVYYFDYSSDKLKSSGLGGLLSRIVSSYYLCNDIERSSFGFLQSMFLRDRMVRLNILPMAAVPIGLTIFAIFTNQLPPPFGYVFFDVNPVFHISIFISVLMAVNAAVRGIKATNETDAAWVYESFPIENKLHFINGIRKFFVLELLLPLTAILFILYITVIPFFQALIHIIFVLVCTNLFNSLYHAYNKDLPFTRENTIFNSIQRITSLVYPIVFGGIFAVLQYYVYRSYNLTLITIIATITANMWVNYFAFRRTGRSTKASLTQEA